MTPSAMYRALVPLPDDLAPERRAVLRRIEARVWATVLPVLLTGFTAHFLIGYVGHHEHAIRELALELGAHFVAAFGPGLPATVLILRLAFARSIEHAQEEARLREAEARAARLDGALLVARTAAHRINNALSPVVGYAELLSLTLGDAGAAGSAKARGYVAQIAEAADQTVEEMARLQRIVRLEEDRASPVSVLDLDASTAGVPLTRS